MFASLLFGLYQHFLATSPDHVRSQPHGSASQRGRTSVLLAGNSLLLHGVDLPNLQRTVSPDLEVHKTVFENTGYLDSYYGLRRLFKGGSRPNLVVLVLSPSQLVSNWTDGDYSVKMLVDRRDLLSFASDLRADWNRMSVLALDNVSYFFGTRAETRSWILGVSAESGVSNAPF
jgi:hypothetical protein